MKKWIGAFLSIFLILSFLCILGFFQDSRRATEKQEGRQIVLTQYAQGAEKRGEKDTFLIDLMKQLKQIVDGLLKSINDQIENEDVTRFKVSFLEILRSILEWVKDKIDSWLESSEKDLKDKGGPLRQSNPQRLPFQPLW